MLSYRNLFLAILSMSVYGCVKNETIKPAEFENEINFKYPPIAVYGKHPSTELENDCREFDKKSLLHHCTVNFFDITSIKSALEDTNLFQQVRWADRDLDYSLSITTATYDLEDAGDLTSAALAGASLMLLPVQLSYDIISEFAVRWRGIEIKQYAYDMPVTRTLSLLSGSPEEQDKLFAEALVSHFLNDSQNDNIFSGEYLAGSIQASDYVNDLVVPKRIGDYFLAGKNVFPDPMLGVSIRYNHGVLSEYVDIFIYPVRSVDWENVANILEPEAVIVRKDIELMQKQEAYKDVVFNESEWFDVESDKEILKGLHFSSTLVDKNDIGYISLTYLSLIKDKIIKFRATRQDPTVKYDIYPFVKEALNKIDPPDESMFMASVRQNARKNTISSEPTK